MKTDLSVVASFRPESEMFIDEGCYIVELHNNDRDADCSIARARLPAGRATRLHSLAGTVERYVIIEGTGLVRVGPAPEQAVAAMDIVTIPADIPQRITNTGQSDLIFLCICTPRFVAGNYQDLANHK